MQVHILTASRDNSIYDALSYTWGSHFLLRRIIEANNRKILVTDSLFRALRELRHDTEIRTIWIDALCINQHNNIEKGRQIAIMRNIFQNAQKVYVWLGEAPQHLASAFDIIQSLANANQIVYLHSAQVTPIPGIKPYKNSNTRNSGPVCGLVKKWLFRMKVMLWSEADSTSCLGQQCYASFRSLESFPALMSTSEFWI